MQATKKKGRLVPARLVVNALLYPQSFDSQCQALAIPAAVTAIVLQRVAKALAPRRIRLPKQAALPEKKPANVLAL